MKKFNVLIAATLLLALLSGCAVRRLSKEEIEAMQDIQKRQIEAMQDIQKGQIEAIKTFRAFSR